MVNIKFIKARKIKTLLSNKRNEKPLEFTEVKEDEESQAEYHETLYSVDEPETFSEDYDPLLVHDLIGIQQTIDTIDQDERNVIERTNGKIRFCSGIPQLSTSIIISKILDLYKKNHDRL